MKKLKKFLVFFAAMIPMSAGAIAPLVIAAIAAGVAIVGVSVWRTIAPVDMQSSLDFFSSCWTCQIFNSIISTLSNLLPAVYESLGLVIIPFSVILLAIFIAWRLGSGLINGKMEGASKILGNLSTYAVKLSVLVGLLLIPLPRLITHVLVEPALTVGTSLDYVVSDNNKFSECIIATAILDAPSVTPEEVENGAFSPKLRYQLTCEIANVHQITGLGMMVGWTLTNMAFDWENWHKLLHVIPLFPNVVLLGVGIFIFILFFYALLPIPFYFLEIFVKLSMDLIMLPLMLLAWMFDSDNFALFPQGGKTIRQMIDDVINGVVGIALTIVFVTFAIMFFNAAFGDWNGVSLLEEAIAKNDSEYLIEGLTMGNNSIIMIVLMGIFIAMFMTMIPQLISMLFKVQMSNKYYETVKNDVSTLWKDIKKISSTIKK